MQIENRTSTISEPAALPVRLARREDAERLYELNREFNGEGVATAAQIRQSLEEGGQELVFVAEWEGHVCGFCCVQVVRSMCYTSCCAEITELYVEQGFRRKGAGAALICFAEKLCNTRYGVTEFKLLTGSDNLPAQGLYCAIGYVEDDELLFVKQLSDFAGA